MSLTLHHVERLGEQRDKFERGSLSPDCALDAELSQMVIDVFVHENGPLLRFERTKERVWVLGATRCAVGGEAVDRCDELSAFSLEVALCVVRGKELRRRR